MAAILGGRPEQVGYKFADGSYKCTEFALEHIIDDRQRANADDPIRLDPNATTLLTQKHMIKQDRVWAQNFFVPSAWSTQAQGVVSAPGANQFIQFNDALSARSSSSTTGRIRCIRRRLHAEYTGAWLAVKRILRSNPDIADRIKYTKPALPTKLLGRLFEIENVIMAGSICLRRSTQPGLQYIADPTNMDGPQRAEPRP